MQLSASSAALDLALSQSPGPDAAANGWGAFNRHRQSLSSLTMNNLHGSTPSSQANEATSPTTVRSAANSISGGSSNPNSHAQQHLHNHNASLGRIPLNAVNNRLSRDLNS